MLHLANADVVVQDDQEFSKLSRYKPCYPLPTVEEVLGVEGARGSHGIDRYDRLLIVRM